jgi:hypothetical protein
MARFIEISDGVHINADMIMQIEEEGKTLFLKMVDGSYRRTASYRLSMLTGAAMVKSIVPVEGFCYKHRNAEGEEELLPLHFVGITNDGEIRAIDPGDYEPHFIDGAEDFLGVFKGDEDLLWENRGL